MPCRGYKQASAPCCISCARGASRDTAACTRPLETTVSPPWCHRRTHITRIHPNTTNYWHPSPRAAITPEVQDWTSAMTPRRCKAGACAPARRAPASVRVHASDYSEMPRTFNSPITINAQEGGRKPVTLRGNVWNTKRGNNNEERECKRNGLQL